MYNKFNLINNNGGNYTLHFIAVLFYNYVLVYLLLNIKTIK